MLLHLLVSCGRGIFTLEVSNDSFLFVLEFVQTFGFLLFLSELIGDFTQTLLTLFLFLLQKKKNTACVSGS